MCERGLEKHFVGPVRAVNLAVRLLFIADCDVPSHLIPIEENLIPTVMPATQFQNRRRGAAAWVVLAGACAALSATAWAVRPAPRDTSFDAPVPRVVKHDEFAASDACRSCHPGAYHSWHRSYHRTMTQMATPEAVVAPFDRELQDDAVTCRLEKRGDEFWVTVFETNWQDRYYKAGIDPNRALLDPRLSPYLTRQVLMTTGSHHMQIYWVEMAGKLVELPFYYQIDLKRWIPRDDSVIAPPMEASAQVSSSEWRARCIQCHSVGGIPGWDETRSQYDATVAEFGISCEACHGPGREHIEYHRNPVNRYREHLSDEPDSTIVNPANLSPRKSTEVCAQCHTSFDPHDHDQYLKNGVGYRAGGDQAATHAHHEFSSGRAGSGEFTTFWKDGTVCVGGDEYLGLAESPCFQAGEMSCLSCHSMHDSDPSDQLKKGMESDQACLQCHEGIGERITEHTHHAADSAGSRCYNCHMPHSTYALFTAMRSHRVTSPDAQSSVETGTPNACNLCHLDQTLEWTSDRLADWYGQPRAELPEDHRSTAASLLWLLRGNAAQRVIAGWHMGWEESVKASGSDWQASFLASMLNDDYAMVRFVAGSSLNRLPGYENIEYDYICDPELRRKAAEEVIARSQQRRTEASQSRLPEQWRHLLSEPDGVLRKDDVDALLDAQDKTPVIIAE